MTTTSHSCELPTLGLLLANAAVWIGAIALTPALGAAYTLPIAAIMVTLHSSLQHEVLHGHPTRYAWLNEALVYCSPGLFIPYRRFKALHLRHHNNDRLTDPYDDPESFYLAWRTWAELPAVIRFLLKINNTLIGRLLIGPLVSLVGFYGAELRQIAAGSKAVRRAWLHHLAGLLPVLLILHFAGGLDLWLYALAAAYPGMGLLMLRTFAEHRAHETVAARSIIVEHCPIFSFLFLNNNLHLVHHTHPRAAWYDLPALYRKNREAWQAKNEGYVFASYLDLIRQFAFKQKEPVVHPLTGGMPAEKADR